MPNRVKKRLHSSPDNQLRIPCLTCAIIFTSIKQLENHMNDMYHYKTTRDPCNLEQVLYLYLNAFYDEEVVLGKRNRRNARKLVKGIIQEVMTGVRKTNGGMLYSQKLTTAGSTATKTKVGKADEFDYNVPLQFKYGWIKTKENVYYDFKNNVTPNQENCHPLFDHKEITHCPTPIKIPNGYCTVSVTNDIANYIRKLTFNNDLIPRYVHEDLYKKLNEAIQKRRSNDIDVKLQTFPHGPALTIIIKSNNPCPEITHNISVDFAVSIECQDESISEAFQEWKTKKTRKCLGQPMIDKVMSAGIHLIPKKDKFWYISYSNSAKVLLNNLDKYDECRRKCHKIFKRDFQIWKSKSSHGFKGISSYIFKHHLFWMNEAHYKEKDYWKAKNIGKCYLDMLQDFAQILDKKELPNYFSRKENILDNKDPIVLKDLANCMRQRRHELESLQVNDNE